MEMNHQTYEGILNGPDYFTCERFRSRMRKAVCIERQPKKDIVQLGDRNHLECQDCEQGRLVAGEKPRQGQPFKKSPGLRVLSRDAGGKGESIMDGMKRCKGCLVEKPLDEFHRNTATRDGRDGRCKVCKAEYARALWLRKKGKPKQGGTVTVKDGTVTVEGTSEEVVVAETIETAQAVAIGNDTGNRAFYDAAAAAFISRIERRMIEAIVGKLDSRGEFSVPQKREDA